MADPVTIREYDDPSPRYSLSTVELHGETCFFRHVKRLDSQWWDTECWDGSKWLAVAGTHTDYDPHADETLDKAKVRAVALSRAIAAARDLKAGTRGLKLFRPRKRRRRRRP